MGWRSKRAGMALLLALCVSSGGPGAAWAAGTDLEQAITLYRQGAYGEAGRLLERVVGQEPQNGSAHFFTGAVLDN